MKVLFILQLVLVVALASAASRNFDDVNEISCPTAPESIAPCTCEETDTNDDKKKVHLRCNGPTVTQNTIDKLMHAIRREHKMKRSETVQFSSLEIQNTTIDSLDLEPLTNIMVERLLIWDNKNLNSIDPPSSKDYGSIFAIQVNIGGRYTAESFGDALKYFYQSMKILQVSGVNMNQGKSSEVDEPEEDELLPGLSLLTQLLTLHFIFNRLAKLGPRKFRKNNRLTYLDLYGNGITEVDDEAFFFDSSENHEENEDNDVKAPLKIELNQNRLTNSGLRSRAIDTLLKSANRPVRLYMQSNELDTLPETTFKQFLQRDSENILDLYGNPLNCDRRVRWLKQGAKRFQKQVFSAQCKNDKGKTVFDSTKV